MNAKSLTFCSFNMHGYRQGELYVQNNISKYDF